MFYNVTFIPKEYIEIAKMNYEAAISDTDILINLAKVDKITWVRKFEFIYG